MLYLVPQPQLLSSTNHAMPRGSCKPSLVQQPHFFMHLRQSLLHLRLASRESSLHTSSSVDLLGSLSVRSDTTLEGMAGGHSLSHRMRHKTNLTYVELKRLLKCKV